MPLHVRTVVPDPAKKYHVYGIIDVNVKKVNDRTFIGPSVPVIISK